MRVDADPERLRMGRQHRINRIDEQRDRQIADDGKAHILQRAERDILPAPETPSTRMI